MSVLEQIKLQVVHHVSVVFLRSIDVSFVEKEVRSVASSSSFQYYRPNTRTFDVILTVHRR